MNTKDARVTEAENAAFAWLAKLNTADVDPTQEREFFIWLQASALHQAAYIKAEQLWERGAILEHLPETTRWSRWHFAAGQQWAFACAGIFAVALLLFMQLISNTESFATAMGEQKKIELEDGSVINLNSNSRIDIEFDRHSRIAHLKKGEVFFDVRADKERPFDVVTEFGVVRVVGTHFSVYQAASDAVVTVIEGRVALGKTVADQFVSAAVLHANERLGVQAADMGQVAEQVNANAVLAWRKKQLVFRGDRLSQVIVDLSRYYPHTITVADKSLGDREITAVIQLTDIKTTLNALLRPLHVHAEFDPAGQEIKLVADSIPPAEQPK